MQPRMLGSVCALALAALASTTATTTATAASIELGLGAGLGMGMGGATFDNVLARRLAAMSAAATEEELQAEARTLYNLYKLLNQDEARALGDTEDARFQAFYDDVFLSMRALSPAASSPTPSPTKKTTTPTKKPSKTYKVTATGEATSVADGLSFLAKIYDAERAKKIQALEDYSGNIEAIVQSSSDSSSSGAANTFTGPTVVDGYGDQTPDVVDGRRRLTSGEAAVSANTQVLFCDVSGNAIWKWSHTPYDADTPINTTTTVNVLKPPKVCEAGSVEVKVSAYQSGCSRQNHPEGCDNVYYKGCGGLTVHPDSSRVVVARTGGRSLGLLYYKSQGESCQGRVIDAITHYRGKKFNSPSYAEYAANGDLFFSDSPFGLATGPQDFEGNILDQSPLRELPFNGVYRLRANATAVELVDCTMDRPNKIAFSPAQDVMYVTNSRRGDSYVRQYELLEDGSVGDFTTFFNFTAHPELETDEGYADGIKVDDQGNVYVAVYKSVFVLSAEGDLIGTLEGTQEISGVALGGGRMFLSGAFGLVAQATGVVPSMPVPKAQTQC